MGIIKLTNPFVVGHYESAEYFCDRENETKTLIKHIENGRNVTLTSPRRMGKTGLISHLFAQQTIKERYYTYFIDLYATSSLTEFVALMSKVIYNDLRRREANWTEKFVRLLASLRPGIKVDPSTGSMAFDIGLGEITSPQVTLDEIFDYLERAERHCIVAIDEFQQIMNYDEKNIEALLRTKIQHCRNVSFIFTGSKRHLMTQMFLSQSKPFYQSAIGMSLDVIPLEQYVAFAQRLFADYGKSVDAAAVEMVYNRFYGYTWYVQMVMNELFAMTGGGERCEESSVDIAVQNVLVSQSDFLKAITANLATKQKFLLQAIACEECSKHQRVTGITTADFLRRYSLSSASSVQAAMKGLIDKECVTNEGGSYHIEDLFLAEFMARK